MQLLHVGRLRVRSARSLAQPCEGLVEHERGGGGHFSPRHPEGSRCFASTALRLSPLIFSGRQPAAGAGNRVTGGRIHSFPAFISDIYGGEGKTASSILRNLSWPVPNPFPGVLHSPHPRWCMPRSPRPDIRNGPRHAGPHFSKGTKRSIPWMLIVGRCCRSLIRSRMIFFDVSSIAWPATKCCVPE